MIGTRNKTYSRRDKDEQILDATVAVPPSKMDSQDIFDKLLSSPEKQVVEKKPLSFWKKKLEDLENKQQIKTKTKKTKDLYELSSFEGTPCIKKKRKPKPRKRKNLLSTFGVSVELKTGTTKKAEPKVVERVKNEGLRIKERIFLKKYESNKSELFLGEKPSFFGISSTPTGKHKVNFVCGGDFGDCSPLFNNLTSGVHAMSDCSKTPVRREQSVYATEEEHLNLSSCNEKTQLETKCSSALPDSQDGRHLLRRRANNGIASPPDDLHDSTSDNLIAKRKKQSRGDSYLADSQGGRYVLRRRATDGTDSPPDALLDAPSDNLVAKEKQSRGDSHLADSHGGRYVLRRRTNDATHCPPDVLLDAPRDNLVTKRKKQLRGDSYLADSQGGRYVLRRRANDATNSPPVVLLDAPSDNLVAKEKQSRGDSYLVDSHGGRYVLRRRRDDSFDDVSAVNDNKNESLTSNGSEPFLGFSATVCNLAEAKKLDSSNPKEDSKELHRFPHDEFTTAGKKQSRDDSFQSPSQNIHFSSGAHDSFNSGSATIVEKNEPLSFNGSEPFLGFSATVYDLEKSVRNSSDSYECMNVLHENKNGDAQEVLHRFVTIRKKQPRSDSKMAEPEGNQKLLRCRTSDDADALLKVLHDMPVGNFGTVRNRQQGSGPNRANSKDDGEVLLHHTHEVLGDGVANLNFTTVKVNVIDKENKFLGCEEEVSPYFAAASTTDSPTPVVTAITAGVKEGSAIVQGTPSPPSMVLRSRKKSSPACQVQVKKESICKAQKDSRERGEEEEDELGDLPNMTLRNNATLLNHRSGRFTLGQNNQSLRFNESSVLNVLKGGKHHRSRSILHHLKSGHATFMDDSVVMHAPANRGRNYESFVSKLIDMQPDAVLETTLGHLSMKHSSIIEKSKRWSRRPSRRPSLNVRRSTQFSKFDSSFSTTLVRQSNMERSMLLEHSMRVIPFADSKPTPFRTAYSIQDPCADDLENTCKQNTAYDVILSICGQDGPLEFSAYFNESKMPKCNKIGEGVYGEVFMYNSAVGKSVLKVIPIEGDLLVNDEPQKTCAEILSEVVITKELSDLRTGKDHKTDGFTELRRVWLVQGEYPDYLRQLWDNYDMSHGSENDNPEVFEKDQLYIVLELAHGGVDLEQFVFQNARQTAAAFQQLAFSLAVAERALAFEHRDLHWGNILLYHTADKRTTFVVDGKECDVPTHGVKVTIIDFTLSRMTYDGCHMFNDLAVDPTLFDSTGDYQFEIYRLMRTETENNWQLHRPRTNVFWLHYVLDKMVTMVRHKEAKSRTHADGRRKLKCLVNDALNHENSLSLALSTV